ncbi:hypothetical protein ACJX0J_012744 [Zea mays]
MFIIILNSLNWKRLASLVTFPLCFLYMFSDIFLVSNWLMMNMIDRRSSEYTFWVSDLNLAEYLDMSFNEAFFISLEAPLHYNFVGFQNFGEGKVAKFGGDSGANLEEKVVFIRHVEIYSYK